MNSSQRLWNRPCTALLVFLFRIIAFFRPLPSVQDAGSLPKMPKMILIFSTAGIGDTLSDTPAIRAVKESFPQSHVTVVVHRKRMPLLEANPYIDALIPHRKHLFTFFSTLRKIRSLNPEIAVILRANDPDVWPLAYLSGARVVVSRRENTVFPFLVNCPASVPNWPDLPGVLQTLEIVNRVRPIGAKTDEPHIVYKVKEEERREMEMRLLAAEGPDANGTTRKPLLFRVAVHIHHSPRLTFRDWPVESFRLLCQHTLEEFPVKIYLTGGPADTSKAGEIHHKLERHGVGTRIVDWAGKLSLRQTGALLEQSALLITTDTGIMHMGFALNVPTIALLHPYNAHRVGPCGYGSLHRTLVMEGPARDVHGELRPLSHIPVEAVLNLFRTMYEELAS